MGAMDGFGKQAFTAPISSTLTSFDIYTIGSGPPVILIQEMPGIGPEAIAFCKRLADAGFEVWAPHWFGPLGRTSALNAVRMLCMRREFQVFAQNQSSAIVDWMRALCLHVAAVRDVERLGVIGMCLSGNFAMTLIAEPNVWAAVASQPSLPVGAPGALHMSDAEIEASRAALDAKGAMRAYRFKEDPLCTAAKFGAVDSAFNDGAVRVVTNVLPGKGHGVFTGHYDDTPGSPTASALREMIDYLRARLA
ncbi:MAG: dienelactone hydrolase family protein [Proteobacteria bacterium]|nr:dienelactone hydrolase family protein [Pseudomonadota bacterium]